MSFISFEFIIFLLVVVPLYRFCPARFRQVYLLIASYTFYCTWNYRMAIALAAATVGTFFIARAIEAAGDNRRKVVLTSVAVSGLVIYLAGFKIAAALRSQSGLLIPLGISYYTFRLIGYLADVYWSKLAAERSLVIFAGYVAFFPQIVAGPIQRADSFLPQVQVLRDPNAQQTMAGIGRILFGLFKKVVVADQLAAFVNIGINDVAGSNAGMRLLSFYVFPLQLFTDFSALTDIANGIARLFGIEAPENFEAPFTAASISEFWRRWHMTLTSWLRNYVFTPMLMATRNWGKFGLAFSLAVNMVLIGLWHGFTVAFLVFGLTHAAYLIIDAFTLPYRKRLYKKHSVARGVTSVLGPILTYHQVAVANVFFRAVNFRDGVYLITHLLSGSAGAMGQILQFVKASGLHSVVALGGYTTVEIMEYGRRHGVSGRFVEVAPRWGRWSLYSGTIIGLMILLWLMLDQQGAEFIYAQF